MWLITYPVLSTIKTLERAHAGEECYIFGDGQSIQRYDISRFSDRIGIAVATFPRHKQAIELNLRYWVLAEPFLLTPPFTRGGFSSRTNRVRHYRLYRRREADGSRLLRIVHITNLPVELGSRSKYIFEQFPASKHKNQWRSRRDYFSGSVNSAVSLAIYLGFKRAYLIGFDYTHAPPTTGHWYEKTNHDVIDTGIIEYKRDYFAWAQKYIELITVVPTPQSTNLPSVDYESFTGAKLQYRGHHELATSEDLALLALWPGYEVLD